MDQDLSRAQKESLLVRELSNVGYGLMDPIGQEALTAILKQKSVIAPNLGREDGPRDRWGAFQQNSNEPWWNYHSPRLHQRVDASWYFSKKEYRNVQQKDRWYAKKPRRNCMSRSFRVFNWELSRSMKLTIRTFSSTIQSSRSRSSMVEGLSPKPALSSSLLSTFSVKSKNIS